jgi:hypothetical protein
MRDEAVPRVEGIHSPHRPVADDLGDDGRGRNDGAALVPVDDRLVLGRERAEAEAIYETGFGRGAEIGERLAQTAKVRAMEAVAVDHARRNHPDGDSRRAPRNGAKESLSLLRRDLFRVVQEPEWTDAVVAQAFIVEEDGRSDERAGETSSTCLVRAGDKADPEAPIEGEQLPSRTAHHRGGG